MKKIKVAVVLGGRSVEHPVSAASGAGVLSALDPEQFEAVPVGIAVDGSWVLLGEGAAALAIEGENLPAVEAEAGRELALAVDPAGDKLSVVEPGVGAVALSEVDVVFPVLHGPFGEDGTLQGLLETAGLPYVGAGVLSSAVSMDKDFTKRLLAAADIPVGDYAVLREGRALSRDELKRLGLPLFVKPARAGSSFGVSRVDDLSQLEAAVEEARRIDPKVIVESAFVGARELECGVLGREDGGLDVTAPLEVLGVGEAGWFDFHAKYQAEDPYDFSPELPEGAVERARELAAKVFEVLECSDLARIDFFLGADGELYVNEINTMPGLTPMSGLPQAFAHAGIEYRELVSRLVRLALKRGTGLR